MQDDALLQAWVTKHEREALAELVRRHTDPLYTVCLRLTRNRADAEDLAQDCLVEFARDAAEVKCPVGSWLHARAGSRAQNLLRASRTRRKHEMSAGTFNGATADQQWDSVSPLIDGAIERLPEHVRAPLILRYVDGFSQSEVAAELGVTQATVSRRLKKGVALLRRELKKDGEEVPQALLLLFLSERMIEPAPESLVAATERIVRTAVYGGTVGVPATETGTPLKADDLRAMFSVETRGGPFDWRMMLFLLGASVVITGAVIWFNIGGSRGHEPSRPAASGWGRKASAGADGSRGAAAREAKEHADVAEKSHPRGDASVGHDASVEVEESDGRKDWMAADPVFVQPDRRVPPCREAYER